MLTEQQLEQQEIFNSRRLAHPASSDIMEIINDLLMKSGKKSNIKSMAFWGNPGVGKSAIAESVLKNNPPYDLTTDFGIQRVTPVLYCSFPSSISTKNVVKQLLNALGQRIKSGKSEFELLIDLVDALKSCGVKMIILDETNHLIDRAKASAQQDVINFMKSLIDDTQLPIVLIGSADVGIFTESDAQLKRRIKHRRELKEFGYPTNEDSYLYQLLTPLFEVMQSDCGVSLAKNTNRLILSQRIYIATGGNLDAIRELLSDAIENAWRENSKVLLVEHFDSALRFAPPATALKGVNPFEASPKELSDWAKGFR